MILWVKGSEWVASLMLCRRENYSLGVGASVSK
jgi:hypothetical protein